MARLARPGAVRGWGWRRTRSVRGEVAGGSEARENNDWVPWWPHPRQTVDEALPRPGQHERISWVGQGWVVGPSAGRAAWVREPARRAKMADQIATRRAPSPSAAKGRRARRGPAVVRDANRRAER